MVMEASRAEYLADNKFKPQLGRKGSSTSGAEPSSSGASKFSDFTQGMVLQWEHVFMNWGDQRRT